eukprot:Blabericola_migrator_1__10597@NODE_601_length_7399_cov_48_594790_g438_i0_p3_GENE_NODE_601_length_7399_cov_48_594790_g438_i0NODE_601_length_7399_cov_48_594790_g438_i0_p3_ORF_typecomplete_len423_score36_10DSPc/PF00782_20/9e11CDKN3/PF05706_12/1_9e08CBM_20/PF00686_19/1_3e07Y_phosphatase2/PF03162_13/4e06Y_phosphatase3/PF13350_6/1_6e05Y_phosphatase/PF00102_27/0_00043DUF442/PF04273_13/0_17_NODE_601_length_7399_cov_48_594790_g438_i060757343
MLVKFSVVVFAGPNTRVAVVGSIPELGLWKPGGATPLYPQEVPVTEIVPTYFSALVDLDNQKFRALVAPQGPAGAAPSVEPDFRYKFIKWEISGGPTYTQHCHVTTPFPIPTLPSTLPAAVTLSTPLYTEAELALPLPLTDVPDRIVSSYGNPPSGGHSLVWEGTGPHHDRVVYIRARIKSTKLAHVCDPQNLLHSEAGETYYALPPADFMDHLMGEESSEYIHTTRYYERVKLLRGIHFNQIIPRVYCGSCPRRLEHLKTLRDLYNIGTVFCLQSNPDIEKNWIDDDAFPDPVDRNAFTLHQIYKDHGVKLVHIPTEDMCTEARANMIAQAAWLMAGILRSETSRSVYVHCNAGVGRAIGCTCAFLHCCLGLSQTHTLHLVRSRRPVAFFDPAALSQGKQDFDSKFGMALKALCMKVTDSE